MSDRTLAGESLVSEDVEMVEEVVDCVRLDDEVS